MTAFLLIASASESCDGTIIPAEEMARRRLGAGLWALYANTPHKSEIEPGDRLIIYLAGKGGMRFFASAKADAVNFKVREYKADGDAISDPPVAVLSLSSTRIFSESVPISDLKEKLQFIPKQNPKWGCVLQRGVKRISDADADMIFAETKSTV